MTNATLTRFPSVYCPQADPLKNAPIIALGDPLTGKTLSRGRGLLPCDDWDAAEFRYPTGVQDLAVNVEITGTRVYRKFDAGWTRIKVTFVGDVGQ